MTNLDLNFGHFYQESNSPRTAKITAVLQQKQLELYISMVCV